MFETIYVSTKTLKLRRRYIAQKNLKKIHLQQFSFVFEERLVLENQINPLKARSLSGLNHLIKSIC